MDYVAEFTKDEVRDTDLQLGVGGSELTHEQRPH
jgi:hypothetical protein